MESKKSHGGGKHQQQSYSSVTIRGQPMASLVIDGKERVCLAQISNTLLRNYTYNEIHNRRVALGINCIQCTPEQLEMLREAGAMPVSSRRCGMITKKEAERLIKSFLEENKPLALPDSFTFHVEHRCTYGCSGTFYPSRYNSSRAKCIRCSHCGLFFSPNKFIFHSHELPGSRLLSTVGASSVANFNSWRKHIILLNPNNDEELSSAWEDVKSIFNSGKRRRVNTNSFKNGSRQVVDDSSDLSSDSDSMFNYSLDETSSYKESKKCDANKTNAIDQESRRLSEAKSPTVLQSMPTTTSAHSDSSSSPFAWDSFRLIMPSYLDLARSSLQSNGANLENFTEFSHNVLNNFRFDRINYTQFLNSMFLMNSLWSSHQEALINSQSNSTPK